VVFFVYFRAESILNLLVGRFWVILFVFCVVDFVVLGVITLFQDVSGWILEKIVRDLMQAQKGNSYLFNIASLFFVCFRRRASIEARSSVVLLFRKYFTVLPCFSL